MPPKYDLTGLRFGKLTVLTQAGYDPIKRNYFWHCLCDCGTSIPKMNGNYLTKANGTVSCGCYRLEKVVKHGKSHTRLHAIWRNMVSRCTNPNDSNYSRYGAVGISVCDRWLVFDNFVEDMGEDNGLTIDRYRDILPAPHQR